MIEIRRINNVLPMDKMPLEIVERKGIGHPDTICDEIGERISLYFTKYYVENFGYPLHFNIDKCVLAGGRSKPKFGGGQVIEPILLHFVGRATLRVRLEDGGEEEVPVGTLIRDAVFDWIRENFRFLDPYRHISIMYTIRPGSVDLQGIFDKIREEDIPLANDTSIGVGYYPLSKTEKVCLEAERFLNSIDLKKKFPAVGEDIKVMCVRRNDVMRLTVGMATIDKMLNNVGEYENLKESVAAELINYVSQITSDMKFDVGINVGDDPSAGIYYITVTGTSAESGDDGQIGRGNRWNGLITPLRYMSIEAHSGKNPVTHVGKIYQYAAWRVAKRIYEEVNVDEVYVLLVSTIGKPITEPQIAYVQYVGAEDSSDIKNEMNAIVQEILNELPNFWKDYINGKISFNYMQ